MKPVNSPCVDQVRSGALLLGYRRNCTMPLLSCQERMPCNFPVSVQGPGIVSDRLHRLVSQDGHDVKGNIPAFDLQAFPERSFPDETERFVRAAGPFVV